MAQCKYCQKEISWFRTSRKSIPIENDGLIHQCKEFKEAKKNVKKLSPNNLSQEEIARYEKSMNESAEQFPPSRNKLAN